MNGKKWLINVEQGKSNYSTEIEHMVSLYIQAVHEFYKLDLTENENHFVEEASKNCEKKSDYLFLEWIKTEGLTQLKRVFKLTLPFDKTVMSKLKLVIGALEDELNWEEKSKKSTRSTVVNTLSDLAERLVRLSTLALEEEKIKVTASVQNKHSKFDFLNKKTNIYEKPLETVGFLL
ncbi:hypothetical protein [Lysinibacillus xylanilyticus]|uniref:Uncharacterized protein n=1 Tax=Lysinibacillus xylanilyticus TaxID=582475 RepID=A0ABV3W033_9BACI